MIVSHNGVQHTLFVKPGAQGKLEFQQRVRDIFGLNANDIIDLTFGCKAPGTGLSWHWLSISSFMLQSAIKAGTAARPGMPAFHI